MQKSAEAFGGGLTDAALFRLSAADGRIRYATYLGGSGADFVNALVQEPIGNLIAFGNTSSPNFPVTPDALQKKALNPSSFGTAFFAEIDPAGALIYSSYLGGTGTLDFGLAAAIDRKGEPLLLGIFKPQARAIGRQVETLDDQQRAVAPSPRRRGRAIPRASIW